MNKQKIFAHHWPKNTAILKHFLFDEYMYKNGGFFTLGGQMILNLEQNLLVHCIHKHNVTETHKYDRFMGGNFSSLKPKQ